MYIISHSFERANGSKATEVYLWTGSNVSPSAAEDAQLFGRRVAKDNSAKLDIVQQGKESPAFFQALGGIVVTRRGSHSQPNPSQKFMLCGRKHVGHIAFDEVDFSLRSFCSGFPFLVFAGGKLNLWKGVGCTAEEVGCARLIAMDIGLSPDVAEVAEGKEPQSFIDLFPQPERGPKKIFASADHWARKASCERYRTRLFKISNDAKPAASLPPKVTEVAPYAQTDVEGVEGVFVLDAFFEIYIILTPSSRNFPAAFTTALLFAQDYGILAASMEDRPFVPVSTVVVEGAPRDMKACFRHWDDSKWSAMTGTAGLNAAMAAAGTGANGGDNMKRGKSLRVVGLDAAIAAAMARR
ncbi:actin depolymerizing protein [Rhizodiscina lignyota]|uniref:Actin depolymerizing protein n=1 Tax=Rhizodiscina lignyota TaxID=1504668 RepID=A0A9P4I325_9PEZI|nr:actin depolymerizing protein [Rhizodiscina lignyota]